MGTCPDTPGMLALGACWLHIVHASRPCACKAQQQVQPVTPTWRNRSKGRLREGVPVSRMARRAALTAATTASVCSASGGLLEVRSVWLSARYEGEKERKGC